MDFTQPIEAALTVPGLRRRQLLAASGALALPGLALASASSAGRQVLGMVWQPSLRTLQPQGRWAQLGVRQLLVQWSAVDGKSYVPQGGMRWVAESLPDWRRIGRELWAQEVIMGLAGFHSEERARTEMASLVAQAQGLRKGLAGLPLRIKGWYFPVEIDPTWEPPTDWAQALQALPRPLWVSAYDSANLGPQALLDWFARWLPADVGVFFQDGVGVHARSPAVARVYAQQLAAGLGAARFRIIAEAFRPNTGGGFRSATAQEFLEQLDAYAGWPVFAFDGPHYLNDELVAALVAQGVN
jgi:hypothetical protein